MKKISVLIALLFCIAKSWTQSNQKFSVAFGSCNNQNLEQPMWNFIA